MKFLWVLAATALPTMSMADDGTKAVYGCLQGIGESTNWNECLRLTFQDCHAHQVGSEEHLACLLDIRNRWRTEMLESQASVVETLTEEGEKELTGLLQAWPKFVDQKCKQVAGDRSHISSDAALLGCQTTEMLLMANEFRACEAGRSVESYCVGGSQ